MKPIRCKARSLASELERLVKSPRQPESPSFDLIDFEPFRKRWRPHGPRFEWKDLPEALAIIAGKCEQLESRILPGEFWAISIHLHDTRRPRRIPRTISAADRRKQILQVQVSICDAKYCLWCRAAYPRTTAKAASFSDIKLGKRWAASVIEYNWEYKSRPIYETGIWFMLLGAK